MKPGAWIVAAALLVALAACGGSSSHAGGSPTMNPGQDCFGCHHNFTAAGTVYAAAGADAGAGLAGASVYIWGSGAHDAEFGVSTNGAGNFYTSTPFTPPASIRISRAGANASMAAMFNGGVGCAAASCHHDGFRVHVP